MLLSDMFTHFLKQKILLTLAFLVFTFSIALLFPKDSFAVAIDGYGWAQRHMNAYSSNRMVFKTYNANGGAALQADSVSITMVDDFPYTADNITYTCSSSCPSTITISGMVDRGWFVYSDVRKAGFHEVINAGYFSSNIFTDNNDQLNFNVYAAPNAWPYNARLTAPTDGVWLDYEPIYTVSARPSFEETSASVRMFSGSQGPLEAPFPRNFYFGLQDFSEGTIGLSGYMFDNRGADSGIFQASYGLDKTPPTATCSLNPSGVQPYTTTSTSVTLTESDPLSGVAEGDVDVSINGGAWGNFGLPGSGNTMDNFAYGVSSGNTYEFRYRARDNTINNVGVGDQWSVPPTNCGTITVGDWPSPELIFTRQPTDNSPTAEGIISNNYPPASTFGSREFFISNQVRFHGYVKNLGLSIPSGTSVVICFYTNWDPSGPDPGLGDNCSGGDKILLNVNFSGKGLNWDMGEAIPFGSACGDFNGDGAVSGLDFFAILGHFGEQYTDPLAPTYNLDAKDYDLDDDGIISGLDNFMVNSQSGVYCTRDLNFTTSSIPGSYEMVGWVDQGENVDESATPGGEGNNQVSDPYTVCCASGDISVAVNPTQVSIRPSEVIEPAANVIVTWGNSPGSWDDSAIMQLDLSVPVGEGITAVFTDGVGSLGTSMSFRRDVPNPSPIPINITTLNTVEGTYSLWIVASASQTSPAPTFSAIENTTLTVKVGPKAWAKTTEGDVGSMGDINLPPSVNTFSGVGTSDSNNIFHYPSADPLGPHTEVHTLGTTNNFTSRIGRVCETTIEFYGRSYFEFDTSFILSSSKVLSAELRFRVEQPPTNDYDVGLYRYDWPDFAEPDPQLAEDTWHDTISNPVSPTETFSKTDLPPVDEFYTLEITDFDILNKGADTKLYMKPTNEPAQKAWGCDPAVSPYVELEIGSPSLIVVYADVQYFNGEYLAVADGAITQFLSAKDWLVRNYKPQPGDIGLNYPELQGGIYQYLWGKFGSGRSVDLSCGSLPDTSGVYKCDGDFVYIGELGTDNVEAVVFITGNMIIPVDLDLPTLPASQKIIFVVNGNITVPTSHNFPPVLNVAVVQINGFFVTNGTFTSELEDFQLDVNGGVIAQGGFNLERDLGIDCSSGVCNQDTPAERFDYDPSYLYFFARVEESIGHSLLGEDPERTLEEVVP